MNKTVTASIIASALFATPAFADEERLAKINFVSGDNGGALAVAESIYGKSSIYKTAVIDVNSDGDAEIAVQFTENCNNGYCAVSVLKFDKTHWVPVIEDVAKSLSVSSDTNDGFSTLRSDDEANWKWNGSRYFPDPIVDLTTTEFPSQPLTNAEYQDPAVALLSEPNKVLIDTEAKRLNGLTVISSSSQFDCFQVNVCPVIMFKDGQRIKSISALGGTLGLKGDAIYASGKDGYSKYAFSGQSLIEIDKKSAGSRISGY